MRWTLLLFFLLLSSSCSKELIIPEYEGRAVHVPRELSSDALRAKKAFSADYNEEGLRSLAEAKKTELSFKGLKPLWEYAYTEKNDSVHTTIVPLFADEMSVRASNSLGDDDIKKYLKELASTTFLLYVEPQDSLQKGRLGFVEYIPSLRCLERGYKPDPKTFSPPKGFDGEIALYDVKGNQKIHYVYVEGLLQNAYWVYDKEQARSVSWVHLGDEKAACYRKVLIKLIAQAQAAAYNNEPLPPDLDISGTVLPTVVVPGEVDISCLDRFHTPMYGDSRDRDQSFKDAENFLRDMEPRGLPLWMVLDPFFSGAMMVGGTPAPVDPPRIPEPITRPTPQQVMANAEIADVAKSMWLRMHNAFKNNNGETARELARVIFQDKKTGAIHYGIEQIGEEKVYKPGTNGSATLTSNTLLNGVPPGAELIGIIHTHTPYDPEYPRSLGLSDTDRETADRVGIFVIAIDYPIGDKIVRGEGIGRHYPSHQDVLDGRYTYYMYQGNKL